MTNPIAEGFSTITPSLSFKDCTKAIETYKKAFGAKQISLMRCPVTDKVMHAVLEIGNSKIMMSDEFPGCAATQGASFYLYMPDVDASMKQAKDAGLTEKMPAEDMFWGDRLGAVSDENGISWSIAAHKRDVSPEELERGAKEMAEKMKKSDGKKAA